MKFIHFGRNAVLPHGSTDYLGVILEASNEFEEPVKNAKLTEQTATAREYKVPLFYRVTPNPQWYLEKIKEINDLDGWTEAMNLYTIKDMSAQLQNPHRADGWIIAMGKDLTANTSSAWVKLTMQKIADLAWEKWQVPVWFEFSQAMLDDQAWDKAQVLTMKNNLDKDEVGYFMRKGIPTGLGNVEMEAPNDIYDVLEWQPPIVEEPEEEEPGEEIPGEEEEPSPGASSDVLAALNRIAAAVEKMAGVLK